MIVYKKGNLFDEDVEAFVNAVNCVGIMGKGIALQFKKLFPDNFNAYVKAYKNNLVKLGQMFVYERCSFINPRYIINFPTKNHWKEKSKIENIELGLQDLKYVIQKRNIYSIAMPALGCGLGGLDWTLVRNCIEKSLSCLNNVFIVVFEPKFYLK